MTFLLVVIGFVLFSSDSLTEAVHTLSIMAGSQGKPLIDPKTVFYLKDYGVILSGAVLFAFPVVPALKQTVYIRKLSGLQPLYVFTVLLIVTAFLVDASFSPFMYFRF